MRLLGTLPSHRRERGSPTGMPRRTGARERGDLQLALEAARDDGRPLAPAAGQVGVQHVEQP